MTKTEIMLTMHAQISRRIFRTMELGGNAPQLQAMEDEGLISSEPRYRGRHKQRNWFLSDDQHAALTFLFAEPERALENSHD